MDFYNPNVGRTKKVEEEQMVIIGFGENQGAEYVGTSNTKGKSADVVSEGILEVFEEKGGVIENLRIVGSDHAIVIQGPWSGVNRRIEVHPKVKRPLQRVGCGYHFGELLDNAILPDIDGPTIGADKLPRGAIGNGLRLIDKGCYYERVVKFKPIPVGEDLDKISIGDFNRDVMLFLSYSKGIRDGIISANLLRQKIGKISGIRFWARNTGALLLYATSANPSPALKLYAEFTQQIKVWLILRIKLTKGLEHSTDTYCLLAKKITEFIPEHFEVSVQKGNLIETNIVNPRESLLNVLRRNALPLHPEMMLLRMIKDDDITVRERAKNIIIESRHNPNEAKIRFKNYIRKTISNPAHRKQRLREIDDSEVRHFDVPELEIPEYLESGSVYDIINWNTTPVTPPPFLFQWSDEALQQIVEKPQILNLTCYPAHTQQTERWVQEVNFKMSDHLIVIQSDARVQYNTSNTTL